MRRYEYMFTHGKRAFVELRNVRPWRYFQRTIDNPTAPPAWVSGVFDITLTMNLAHLGGSQSTAWRTFIIDHEKAHMTGHHGFWLMMASIVTLGAAYPAVRAWQERRADRRASVGLTDQQVLGVCQKLEARFGREWYHGPAAKRAERAVAWRKR